MHHSETSFARFEPTPAAPARRGALAAFALWAGAATLIGASLMVGHWTTLPKPPAHDSQMTAAVATLRASRDDGRWMAVHVLYTSCRCSQRIFDHVVARPRVGGVAEKLVLIEHDAKLEQRARAAGLSVEVVTQRQLSERFNLVAAPVLVVVDGGGTVRYLGGYTDRKQGPDIRDVAIIEDLVAGQAADALPLFGCAVSQQLQRVLDPLGIKYD